METLGRNILVFSKKKIVLVLCFLQYVNKQHCHPQRLALHCSYKWEFRSWSVTLSFIDLQWRQHFDVSIFVSTEIRMFAVYPADTSEPSKLRANGSLLFALDTNAFTQTVPKVKIQPVPTANLLRKTGSRPEGSPGATVRLASWLTSFLAELDATQRYDPSSSFATSRICSTPVGREMNLLRTVERCKNATK